MTTNMHAKMSSWTPPQEWRNITTIDCHTAGEPFRVITGGFPDLPGDTILARRRYMQQHWDHLRTVLMHEPRGHADMYGCIVTPPVSADADFGVLFLHNEGYSTMCGHGIIAMAMVAVQTGLVAVQTPETRIKIDAPAGLIDARVRISKGHVTSVCFQNVPSFALLLDQSVDVPGLGRVQYDIAFGGAFYAFVQAETLDLTTRPQDFNRLIETGMAIKRAVMAANSIIHPFEQDLSFLYGTIFVGPPHSSDAHSSHVCIFAEGEVDRSPTGTGVSARLALLHARNALAINQPIDIESIIGSRFRGHIASITTFGSHQAVVPMVEGSAYITGRHEFIIDPEDPFDKGFILR